MPCPILNEGQLVRPQSDPHVYLWHQGQLHWVPDGDTFAALGASYQSVLTVDDICFHNYPLGEPLQSVGAQQSAAVPVLGWAQALAGAPPPPPPPPVVYSAAPGGGVAGPPPGQLGVSVQSGALHAGLNLSGVTSFVQQHSTLLLILGAGYVASQLGLIGGGGGGRRHRGLL